MKILAKTTGPTLVCTSGDFLDSYKYRLVDYDIQVRGWNNRNLLEIKGFVEDTVSTKELESLGEEEFIKKYVEKKEEVKVEEAKVEEEVIEPVVEEEPINKKFKKKQRKNI
jgi:hypothetical protein